MSDCSYLIPRAARCPEFHGLWDGSAWGGVPFLLVDNFRPEGPSHRPLVQCKILYDRDCLYGFFLVRDRYVRCVNNGFQVPVYEDSCVELFVQPVPGKGYFNFEFNCGGAILASYVTDPARINGRVAGAVPLPTEECGQVAVYHSLPNIVEPEVEEEITWSLEFGIPFALLQNYVGGLGRIEGQEWRGNLYKCGDKTSHPHWASWSPLSERNFHAPGDFGTLLFAP